MDYTSHNEEDTIEIAQKLAKTLKAGDILALYGDLGVGKSVFCRALIRMMTNNPDLNVPSPTFSLVQTYECEKFEIWHFDLYRLEHGEELYELGWEEALAGNLTLIEWPERIEGFMPAEAKVITFTDLSETIRKITTNF